MDDESVKQGGCQGFYGSLSYGLNAVKTIFI